MSKVFNMVGGGGGKNISSIVITGLVSTDAVTCTKDGKSYTATWDSTAQHWEIVGLPLGTFTVTATNGAKTTTETVLIDISGVYEIEVSLTKFWLYRDGNPFDSVTGGWSEEFYFTTWGETQRIPVTYIDNGIDCDTTSSNYGYTLVGANNKIDLTGYSKLYVEYEVLSTSFGKYWPALAIALPNNKSFDTSDGWEVGGENMVKTGVFVCETDISTYNDSRYITLLNNSTHDGSNNRKARCIITKVWLE